MTLLASLFDMNMSNYYKIECFNQGWGRISATIPVVFGSQGWAAHRAAELSQFTILLYRSFVGVDQICDDQSAGP